MADNTDVLAAVGGENVAGIAAIDLRRSLEEPVLGGGKETGKRNAGIVNSVLAADEIVSN